MVQKFNMYFLNGPLIYLITCYLNLSDFDLQNEDRDNFEFTSTSEANPSN